jgi:hypothetical protein
MKMKEKKLSKLFKIGILFFGVSLLLWNCEKDELIEESTKNQDFPFKLKDKTYAELEKTKKFNDAIEKVFKPKKQVMNYTYSSKTVMEEQYGFTIDSTIVKEISSEKYTSYTMFIHRKEKDDSYYENLLVEIDSVNTISAYILKYIKKSNMILHDEHNSFNQDVALETTRIEYNNTQAKMVYGCKKVGVWYCPYLWEHEANESCFNNKDRLYLKYFDECGWSDDGDGTSGGAPNPSGGSTDSGSGITITAPVLPEFGEFDNFLISLTNDQNDWLNHFDNRATKTLIENFLNSNNYSDESIISTKITIDIIKNSNIEGPYDANYFNQIKPYLSSDITIDPTWTAKFLANYSMEVAILKIEHPNWNNWEIHTTALNETIHLGLAILGMTPVVGIVFDVADGVIYAIQGEGLQAGLSLASAIPVAGQWVASARIAKKVIQLTNGKKVYLKAYNLANGVIKFSYRGQLRKVLGITNSAIHAHHIIPFGLSDVIHQGEKYWTLIQNAAKSNKVWHINDIYNGIPMPNSLHLTGHSNYTTAITNMLDDIYESLDNISDFDEAYDALIHFGSYMKNKISLNSDLSTGELVDIINNYVIP